MSWLFWVKRHEWYQVPAYFWVLTKGLLIWAPMELCSSLGLTSFWWKPVDQKTHPWGAQWSGGVVWSFLFFYWWCLVGHFVLLVIGEHSLMVISHLLQYVLSLYKKDMLAKPFYAAALQLSRPCTRRSGRVGMTFWESSCPLTRLRYVCSRCVLRSVWATKK